MVDIYVLECEKGNFYIGKTNNGEQRLRQHISGTGAKWTQKYQPKSIVNYYRNKKDIDEKKITERIMKKHGPRKVRGGPYVKTKMSNSELRALEKKVGFKPSQAKKSSRKNTANGYHCGKCGRQGHNRTQCYAKTTNDGVRITTKSWKYRPKANTKPKRKSKVYKKSTKSTSKPYYRPRRKNLRTPRRRNLRTYR